MILDHTRENLLRLMASAGLSAHALAEQTGLDDRTIRGLLNGENKPHPRTLHRLAEGLGVHVDELFLDPARLLYRRFDVETNPVVAEVMESHKEWFAGWTEGDFEELHSRFGEGGAMTCEGAMTMVQRMNRKRDLHDKLELLLESSHADLAGGIIDMLHKSVVVTEPM